MANSAHDGWHLIVRPRGAQDRAWEGSRDGRESASHGWRAAHACWCGFRRAGPCERAGNSVSRTRMSARRRREVRMKDQLPKRLSYGDAAFFNFERDAMPMN